MVKKTEEKGGRPGRVPVYRKINSRFRTFSIFSIPGLQYINPLCQATYTPGQLPTPPLLSTFRRNPGTDRREPLPSRSSNRTHHPVIVTGPSRLCLPLPHVHLLRHSSRGQSSDTSTILGLRNRLVLVRRLPDQAEVEVEVRALVQ